MNQIGAYNEECLARVRSYRANSGLSDSARSFVKESIKARYTYNFSWMGRPVIQYPQDLIALQEIIWQVRPDLIVETGIAHGGSLIFFASMLDMLGEGGEVLGIDIDIRSHNWGEIVRHPMSRCITMIEGSSVSEKVVEKVSQAAKNKKSVLVVLDSYHAGDHVLKELELYSPFVTLDSYCVVFDTYIEHHIKEFNQEYNYHCWDGDNPKTAVETFLKDNDTFRIDTDIHDRLLITAAPGGYLRRIKNRDAS